MLQRAMSGYELMSAHQPKSKLMSGASVVTEGQTDDQGLVGRLGPFWCNRTTLLAAWDHVDAHGHAAAGACRSEGSVMPLGPCGKDPWFCCAYSLW